MKTLLALLLIIAALWGAPFCLERLTPEWKHAQKTCNEWNVSAKTGMLLGGVWGIADYEGPNEYECRVHPSPPTCVCHMRRR